MASHYREHTIIITFTIVRASLSGSAINEEDEGSHRSRTPKRKALRMSQARVSIKRVRDLVFCHVTTAAANGGFVLLFHAGKRHAARGVPPRFAASMAVLIKDGRVCCFSATRRGSACLLLGERRESTNDDVMRWPCLVGGIG